MKDPFELSVLKSELSARWLGRRIYLFETIDSTNTRLRKMSDQGEPEGSVVLAEYQSLGKGRLGRQWHAPTASSLLFSMLFRPEWPSDQAQWLMMIAGLSAIEAIKQVAGLDLRLKWPNDIVIGDEPPWRKCGGVLLEGEMEESVFSSAVVGVGINVNISTAQLPETASRATSLQVEAGRAIPRLPLLLNYLAIMEHRYEEASKGVSPLTGWRSALVNIGQRVRAEIESGEAAIEGMAVDVDATGRLLIRDSSGTLHTITAADVTIYG
ncbi:MAG TPA: biotin--[acetyl-CoA-carboxylase] ligase [candidate division Zixibacteria bacterium]|nr:biotin--[acetyl-CoA-carboxylase] ligase [candidate division Zixibacteria bacterium]